MEDLILISRVGKSTNNNYLAFQDKNKNKNVSSKVAKFIGRNQDS